MSYNQAPPHVVASSSDSLFFFKITCHSQPIPAPPWAPLGNPGPRLSTFSLPGTVIGQQWPHDLLGAKEREEK